MTIIHQNSKMAGRFMIERCQIAPDGSEIPGSHEVVAPWQDNLITDAGLDHMGGGGWMGRCHIGAGNTPPSFSDTSLVSSLASRTGNIEQGPSDDDFCSVVGTYVFPPGEGTGIIAEIGVSPGGVGTALTTRALVRDENGNPTTITKGPIDQLTITYQMREYPDKGDTVQQVTNPHTAQEYTVTTRTYGGADSSRMYAWTGTFGPVTEHSASFPRVTQGLAPWDSNPSAVSGVANGSLSTVPYTSGNNYRDVRAIFTETQGNRVGGISSVSLGSSGTSTTVPFRIQAAFDPPLDKDNTKTLTLTFRRSWGRL